MEQKTRSSSLRLQNRQEVEEEEASVVRTTEVSLGRVKWHLTDKDGQLNLAQFEMKDFLYEKVRKCCLNGLWFEIVQLLHLQKQVE